MARWLLKEPHYLNCPNTIYRIQEINQDGEALEHTFPVPRSLDPNDPRHHTNKADKEIVVCYEGKGNPGDRIFVGPPTPGMEPLDTEAQEISAKFSGNWKHPVDSLPGQFSSDALLGELQRQLASIMATQQPSSQLPNQVVKKEDFDALKSQVDELLKANQQLMAQVAQKAEAPKAERRAI